MISIKKETCRACLSKKGRTSLESLISGISLNEMIMEFSNLELISNDDNDDFPFSICHSCVKCLRKAYAFKKMINSIDKKLKQLFCSTDKLHTNNYCTVGLNSNKIEAIGSSIVDLDTKDIRIEDYSTDIELENISIHENIIGTHTFKTIQIGSLMKNNKHGMTSKKLKSESSNTIENRTCNECEKVFSSANNLRIHSTVHSGSKPFKCYTCDKCFTQQASLSSHKQIHSKEKLYVCEFCSKQFCKKIYLKKHMVTHIPDSIKLVKCDQCGKGFRDKGILKRHKAVHENLKGFICGVCNSAFNQRSSLKRHYKTIHLNIKDHICSHCGKTFSSNANLATHVRIHTGEKPYECQYCDAKFNQSTPLARHTRSHLERGDQKKTRD